MNSPHPGLLPPGEKEPYISVHKGGSTWFLHYPRQCLMFPGPPPRFPDIGDPVYGDVSSCLGAPAFSLPVLAVEGLPVGLQYLGWPDDDYALACQSRWVVDTLHARTA